MTIRELPSGTNLKGLKIYGCGMPGYYWNQIGKTLYIKHEMTDSKCFPVHLSSAKNILDFEIL